jgi:hypothetical protein
LHRLSINLAAGTSVTFKDNDVGVQRAIIIPRGIMEQNPFLTFGPYGVRFQLNMTTGVFIQFDAEFDELKIENPAGAAGNAVGDIILSGCPNFLAQSM